MSTNTDPPVFAPPSSPSLVPDFNPYFENEGEANGYETQGDTYARLAGGSPIARASGTVTVDTAGTAGDIFTVTVKDRTVTVISQGTSATVDAADIAAALNADPVLAKLIIATSAIGVVTIQAKYPGLIPNGWALAETATGTTADASVSAAVLENGVGNFITPLDTFAVKLDAAVLELYAGRPIAWTAEIATALSGSGYLYS